MRKLITISCLVVLFVCLGIRMSPADTSIGSIKKLNGAATIVRGKSTVKVNLGGPVFMNDVLKTENATSAGITFKDNTMISVGPNTVFAIDEYVYQPKEQKLSFVSTVSKGTLHFVSGNMTKLAPSAVKVKTPEGTMGIRGTRFLVKVEDH